MFVKLITALIITFTLVIAIIFFSFRKNYNGYCEKESRYLNEQEKITIARDYLLAGYPPLIGINETKNGASIFTRTRPKNVIYYTSEKEFTDINPNCCSLSDVGRTGEKISVLDRLQGRLSTFVRVSYLVRYVNDTGNIISHSEIVFVPITNCGHPWSGM